MISKKIDAIISAVYVRILRTVLSTAFFATDKVLSPNEADL
jgi:hypothetical protein